MKKTLAASFLVTVTAGCTPPVANPGPAAPATPETRPETTVEPAPPPPEPADPVDMETPEPKDGSETAGGLPPPGPGEKVVTKKDGTCWVLPEVDCPPAPATCNPPPPQQVACPEDD